MQNFLLDLKSRENKFNPTMSRSRSLTRWRKKKHKMPWTFHAIFNVKCISNITFEVYARGKARKLFKFQNNGKYDNNCIITKLRNIYNKQMKHGIWAAFHNDAYCQQNSHMSNALSFTWFLLRFVSQTGKHITTSMIFFLMLHIRSHLHNFAKCQQMNRSPTFMNIRAAVFTVQKCLFCRCRCCWYSEWWWCSMVEWLCSVCNWNRNERYDTNFYFENSMCHVKTTHLHRKKHFK